jgi:hypothetical protein
MDPAFSRLSRRPSLWLTTILAGILSSRVTAQSFRSDSKRFDNSKMDIVITETERQEKHQSLIFTSRPSARRSVRPSPSYVAYAT